jgi:hypothetical protein
LIVVALVIAATAGARWMTSPLVAQAASATTRAAQARLADTVIPMAVAIPLLSPANPVTTFRTLERVLTTAGVPFGLEEPSLSSAPLFDFANPPVEIRKLSGMRLGDALDAIAHELPQVRWAEQDGIIVVRLGPAPAPFLDFRVPHLALSGTDAGAAFGTILAAENPARPDGMRKSAGRVTVPRGAATGIEIAVERDNITMVDALNALASAVHGAWIVQYDTPAADDDGTTVVLRAAAGGYTSPSPASRRSPELHDPNLVRLTVYPDLPQVILRYASAAHVTVGVEAIARSQTTLPEQTGIAVPLETTKPAEAIATLVAYDSRYRWLEDAGAFRIVPAPDAAAPSSWLDTPVTQFAATNEPLGTVIDRVIWLSGFPPGGTMSVLPGVPQNTPDAAAQRQRILQIPVTVSFERHGTVADVLDAMCRAAGNLSWIAQPITANVPDVQLLLRSPDGWSLSRAVSLPRPATRPASAPARPLPPARDYQIQQMFVSLDAHGISPFEELLRQAGRLPMGLEVAPAAFEPPADPRIIKPYTPPVALGPGKLSDALYVLLERVPGYEMSTPDGVISIAPSSLLRDPAHFMNVPVDHFEVHDVPFQDAVVALRQKLDPTYPGPQRQVEAVIGPGGERLKTAQAMFDRHVTLVVDGVSAREILNRLVLAHGELRWTVRYSSPSPASSPQPLESNASIMLSTFPEIGITKTFGPGRPSRAPAGAPPTPAPRPAPAPPSGPSIPVALPTTASGLRDSVQSLATRLRLPIGTVVISPPQTMAERNADMAARASTTRYNVAGLSPADALTRILETMPDYAWHDDHGTYHVAPRALTASVLDRPVDHVDRDIHNINEAAALVLSLVDGKPLNIRPLSPNMPERARALEERPFHVTVDQGTVRDVLDAIARQHGALFWFVVLSDASGTIGRFELDLQGFDGWAAAFSTDIRQPTPAPAGVGFTSARGPK